MKTIKSGGHWLFERDEETSRIVSEMLGDLENNGMDAVSRYSQQFDNWNPPSFEMTLTEIEEAIAKVSEQALKDTDYCQEGECPALCPGATQDPVAP